MYVCMYVCMCMYLVFIRCDKRTSNNKQKAESEWCTVQSSKTKKNYKNTDLWQTDTDRHRQAERQAERHTAIANRGPRPTGNKYLTSLLGCKACKSNGFSITPDSLIKQAKGIFCKNVKLLNHKSIFAFLPLQKQHTAPIKVKFGITLTTTLVHQCRGVNIHNKCYKKLCYRRRTARRAILVEILSTCQLVSDLWSFVA